MKRTLWLRHETKPFEQRVALTPAMAKELNDRGHRVMVERSPSRIFADSEYEELGLSLQPMNSWKTHAPFEATIFGLKELETEDLPLQHRHIHFAHVYKGQDGADSFLKRFLQGEGKLYDLEYLTNSGGRRVAAFGVWAGFTGAALGLDLWIAQQLKLNYNDRAPLKASPSSAHMVREMQNRLADLAGEIPKVLVIGARGRCGRGAIKFFRGLGIEPTAWTSKDTKEKKHIKEILDFDILVNCALMTKKAEPWLTEEMFDGSQRLNTISDVSCDPTGPCNPLPVYPEATTMDVPAWYHPSKNFAVTAIDHLPSLLPRESSEDFGSQLFPHLVSYLEGNILNSPWERALNVFYKNLFKCFPDQEDFKGTNQNVQ